jgi:hypothetical protein
MAIPWFVVAWSISQAQQKGKPINGGMMHIMVHKMPHAIAGIETPSRVPAMER